MSRCASAALRGAALAAWALAIAGAFGCTTAPSEIARTNSAQTVALENAGFEAPPTASAGRPQGWIAMQHAGPESYAFATDASVRRSGTKSLRISNVGPEPFGSIVQKVGDRSLRGRTIRYSAWLRTQDVAGNALGGGAVLMVSALANGSPVAHDHMRGAAVKGTTDWRRYEITLAVPVHAEEVEVGAMLFGAGTLWLDDATLEIVAP